MRLSERRLCILFLLGLISGIEANIHEQLAERHQLTRRELVPRDCITSCNAYSTSVEGCSTNLNNYGACICSASLVNELVTCIQCGAEAAEDPALVDELENTLNSYASTCQELGDPISIPSLTLGGTVVTSTDCSGGTTTPAIIPSVSLPSASLPSTNTTATSTSNPTIGVTSPPSTGTSFSTASADPFGDTSIDAELTSLLGALTLTP